METDHSSLAMESDTTVPEFYIDVYPQSYTSRHNTTIHTLLEWLKTVSLHTKNSTDIQNRYVDLIRNSQVVSMYRCLSDNSMKWTPETTVYIPSIEIDETKPEQWYLLVCFDRIQTRKRINGGTKDLFRICLLGFMHVRDPKIWLSLEREADDSMFTLYDVPIQQDIRYFQLQDFSMDIDKLTVPAETHDVFEISLDLDQWKPFKGQDVWCFQDVDVETIKKRLDPEFLKRHSLRRIVLNRLHALALCMCKKYKSAAQPLNLTGDDFKTEQEIGFYVLSTLFCRTEPLRDWLVRAEIIYFIDQISTISSIQDRRNLMIKMGFPQADDTSSFTNCIKSVLEDRIYDFLFRLLDHIEEKKMTESIGSLYSQCLDIYDSVTDM